MKRYMKSDTMKQELIAEHASVVDACPSVSDEDTDSSVTFRNPAPYASPPITGGESEVFVVSCKG